MKDKFGRPKKQVNFEVSKGIGYRRSQPLILVTWTCKECGAIYTEWCYPGLVTPKYCSITEDEEFEGKKVSECQRRANARRVREHRARKRRK